MLELTDVTIRKGGRPLVTGLSLKIQPGSVFWVIGPNGAGKSSLLRVLALLDTPAEGRVRRHGPRDSPILHFHPETAPLPTSTVGSWARLVDRLLPPGSDPEHTALWPDVPADRPVRQLSTGERKRLLLDALFRHRGPMILDEPYEHLSPDAKRALTALIRQRAAHTVVVVATNQAVERVDEDGGLRLEGGAAHRMKPRKEVAP